MNYTKSNKWREKLKKRGSGLPREWRTSLRSMTKKRKSKKKIWSKRTTLKNVKKKKKEKK